MNEHAACVGDLDVAVRLIEECNVSDTHAQNNEAYVLIIYEILFNLSILQTHDQTKATSIGR